MNSEAIYNWIHAVISHYDAESIYEGGQEIPEPAGAHIVYDVTNEDPVYFKMEVSDPVEGGTKEDPAVTVNRKTIVGSHVVVSVNVYNDIYGASRLRQLYASRERQDIQDLFGGAIALYGVSAIRNLQFLGDTKYRNRFQADFDFLVNFEPTNEDVGETLDTLETYDITGETDNDDLVIEASIAE